MPKNIYLVSSFWGLGSEEQKKLRAFENSESPRIDHQDKCDFYLNRVLYSAVIGEADLTLRRLQTISPAFGVLSAEQRGGIEAQLLLIYYQLSSQYEMDRVDRSSHQLPETAEKIWLCAALLNKLRLSACEPKMNQELLECVASSGQYTRYLGVKLLVPVLLESVDTIASGKKSATDFISFINERRLYWVWAGSTVSLVLSVFPDYLCDTSRASGALGWTSFVGGALSWILYFMRAGLSWSALIEHVFLPTKEELELGLTWRQRFGVHWEARKYQILNDTIWGMCNFACFFVLVGSGLLGNIGNALTASLLLMDTILTVSRMYEENALREARVKAFEHELASLKNQIEQARRGNQSTVQYEMAYEEIQSRYLRSELEWRYKKTSTAMDLLYAICLLSAFTLLCVSVLFMPYTALVIAVAGTLMCFAFNLIYSTASMSVNVSKMQDLRADTDESLSKKLAEFQEHLKQYEQLTDERQRQSLGGLLKVSYLEMRALQAESVHQSKMITHQHRHLIVSTIRDVFIPPLFITAFVFLPMGIGVPVLVLFLALAVGLYWYSEKTIPQKVSSPASFPEDEYRRFAENALKDSTENLCAQLTVQESVENSGIQPKYVYN